MSELNKHLVFHTYQEEQLDQDPEMTRLMKTFFAFQKRLCEPGIASSEKKTRLSKKPQAKIRPLDIRKFKAKTESISS